MTKNPIKDIIYTLTEKLPMSLQIENPTIEFNCWNVATVHFNLKGVQYEIETRWGQFFPEFLKPSIEGADAIAVVEQVKRFHMNPSWHLKLEDDEGGVEYLDSFRTREDVDAAIAKKGEHWLGSPVNENDIGWHWLLVSGDDQTEIRIPVLGGDEIITRKGGLQ